MRTAPTDASWSYANEAQHEAAQFKIEASDALPEAPGRACNLSLVYTVRFYIYWERARST
jgi:hypothetical protein